jgi:Zn-dependent peptidase ImmA (M78 family)
MGPRRRRLIRDHARRLLGQFEVIEPPVPVDLIIKHLGIKLVVDRFDDNDISGFYLKSGTEQIIGVNRNHSLQRRRFTMAHELGHVLLSAQQDLHWDGSLRLRDAESAKGTDNDEIEANAFAAELLMPVDMLSRSLQRRGGIDLDEPDDVRHLATEFGVSSHALLIRLSSPAFVLATTRKA